jgi:membrane-bound metal-dependent hydrolase YbcI (DUF457 family)
VFLGHFGVALAAKKAAPKTSLGTLFLAAQFADMLWPVFLLLGWEQVRIAPGITRVTPLDFVSYPYSHSLAAQLIWGVAFGLVYFAIWRDGRAAAILAACVPSHWLLDYVTHRPDMPLFPGSARYGLGLWNSLPGTLTAELGIYGAGVALYLGATRAKDRTGVYALWSLLTLLFVLYFASTFGPPPPSEHLLAMSAIAIWLTVPWAAWADRHRGAS